MSDETKSEGYQEHSPDQSDGDDSAFNPINLGEVLVIQNARLYDLLLALLSESNPRKAQEIEAMHRRGEILSPPPSIILEQDGL